MRSPSEKAVAALRESYDKGHILMARTQNVTRAKEVFEIYRQFTEFNPVELHTGITSERERDEISSSIIAGQRRIIVCVDMLGEGFDLPELKIAAFHDIRKTLAVTLQIAGRFTRSRPGLGDAVFIANTAEVVVNEEISKLYMRDPDWNLLLPQLSDRMIDRQQALQDFLRGFNDTEDISEVVTLKDLRMATSAVVYKTTCNEWSPERFSEGLGSWDSLPQKYHIVNAEKNTLVIVWAQKFRVGWAGSEDVFNWLWDMVTIYWSPERKLLFINSANNSGDYKAIAKEIAGEDVTLIQGSAVFRSFSGINRLRLQNVGLSERIGRNVSYTAKMGANVAPSVPVTHRQRTSKSVISGQGYEGGSHATVGASKKGKIWSHQRVSIDGLISWFEHIGAKVIDERIDPDAVLSGTLEPIPVAIRPQKMPCYVSWPEDVAISLETTFTLYPDEGSQAKLYEADIELLSPSIAGDLLFKVSAKDREIVIRLDLLTREGGVLEYAFSYISGGPWLISKGVSSTREDAIDICRFFMDDPPIFWFVDGSSLEGNIHTELKGGDHVFDASKIEAHDWSGVDIRIESQTDNRRVNSIQYRVIQGLTNGSHEVVVDDDGPGEVADVVAFAVTRGENGVARSIHIDLYHCKFSAEENPGSRIGDLYEVCGQAQKCIKWMSSPERKGDLFTNLMRRDADRVNQGRLSHFEVGSSDALHRLRDESVFAQITFTVHIVQPGLSKARASIDVLRLLSVTENHLEETYAVPLKVIASP